MSKTTGLGIWSDEEELGWTVAGEVSDIHLEASLLVVPEERPPADLYRNMKSTQRICHEKYYMIIQVMFAYSFLH